MANTLISQYLLGKSTEQSQVIVVHFTILGDGSGDESGTVIIPSTALATNARLMKVGGSLHSFSAALLWEGNPDFILVTLPDSSTGGDTHFDWREVGGVPNNATDATGAVLITTSGLGSGDSGNIELWFKNPV